ncbi:sulfurtransferase complex subunit TusB [Pseudomonadota bacterium]
MLHIINKSPFERDNLDSCLRHAGPGSTILFIEDGVYAAMNGTTMADKINEAMGDLTFRVLGEDLEARGIVDKVMDGVERIDYAGFVDLVTESDKVQSWM